jgi:hypothetical protein
MVAAYGGRELYISEVDDALWKTAKQCRGNASFRPELDDYRAGCGEMFSVYGRESLVPQTLLSKDSAEDQLVEAARTDRFCSAVCTRRVEQF